MRGEHTVSQVRAGPPFTSKSTGFKGHVLVELLAAMTIMLLLASLLWPAVIKGFRCCRAWLEGSVAYHKNQFDVYLDDASPEQKLLNVSTNKPAPIWFHSRTF